MIVVHVYHGPYRWIGGTALELRHLRYFACLTETLNFTRAAERVHVTQSTLSHQIRQMEKELGLQLFDRVGKRVMVTESGELFLTYVLRSLKELDQGLSALKQDPSKVSGVIRVGATHTFNLEFIPACVATFLGRYPTVKVTVEELAADAIDSALDKGTLDVGIAYRPASPSELRFEPLYNEEMVLVVSDQHPLSQRKRLRMVELHHQALVLLPATFATRQMLNECFNACGAEPVVAAEMNTIAPMLGLVARTTIAAIVSRDAILPARGLKVIPIESPTPIRIPGLIWKRGITQSAPLRAFAAIVRKVAIERSRRSHPIRHAKRKKSK
jgi:LysR family cyn operon transcriptional activator